MVRTPWCARRVGHWLEEDAQKFRFLRPTVGRHLAHKARLRELLHQFGARLIGQLKGAIVRWHCADTHDQARGGGGGGDGSCRCRQQG